MVVINNSGRTITSLYISADGGETWGDNCIGSDLWDGYQTTISYNVELARTKYFSVFVYYDNDDNDYAQWNNFDFEGATQLEFHSNGNASVG